MKTTVPQFTKRQKRLDRIAILGFWICIVLIMASIGFLCYHIMHNQLTLVRSIVGVAILIISALGIIITLGGREELKEIVGDDRF